MEKFKLEIEWTTNEYYMVDSVTLTLSEVMVAAIKKAQAFLRENQEYDSIRVRVDENCIETDSDLHRLGYGFILVRAGETLYFVGTDHFDSTNQVETEGFTLEDEDYLNLKND